MSKIQTVAAIDIGTQKIVVIAGNKDEQGRVKVLGYGEAPSKGVVHGTVQNVGDLSIAISEAVAKCKEMSHLQFQNVFVGIAGQNIRTMVTSHTKYINTNIITQDDVDCLTQEVYKLNMEPGEEIIHVIPQEYYVDNNCIRLSAVGCSGRRLDGRFYVVLGNANAIQKIKQAISMVGLNILRLIYQPIASADAVLSADDKEVGTLVADIGAGTTDITIYHDKVLRTTACIPFGSNSITNDIKEACKVIKRQAELLKLKYASAFSQSGYDKKIITVRGVGGRSPREISQADLANVVNARMDEILAGILHVMRESGYMDNISEIVITGGGAQLANLNQLVKFRLGRDVRIGKPRDMVIGDKFLSGVEYATIVGLLFKGIEYNENYVETQKRRQGEEAINGHASDSQKTSQPAKEKEQKPKDSKKSGGFGSRFKIWLTEFFQDPEESKM